jgi:glutathione synthase/RimK-type ligase-like ATP-grasp enzyme
MPHLADPRRRIALVADPGRAWKLDTLLPLLGRYRADVWTTADLLGGAVSQADIAAYDLVFLKTKEEPALAWLRGSEALGARLINSLDAIACSKDRARALAAAAAAGVPVAEGFCGPLRDVPFPRFVLKPPLDHDDAMTPRAVTSPAERAAAERDLGPEATIYAQAYIDTTWELKLYGVGGEVFGFRQLPTLVSPDKHASRQPLPVSDDLAALTTRTLRAVGLCVGGVDLLGAPDRLRVTDINSTQGLQSFPQGYAALTRLFDRCLASP